MFYDRFCELCKKNGLKPTNVVNELNLSSGNMTNWKSGRVPKTDVLTRIAEYFNVSVDSLLGKEDTEFSTEKEIADSDIKFALFGDVAEHIPDEKLQEVKKFAEFIKNEFKKEQ